MLELLLPDYILAYFDLKGGRKEQDVLSDFKTWDQRAHARQWILYPENLGQHLSIDETSLTHDELYTIITNKEAKGRKGSITGQLLERPDSLSINFATILYLCLTANL